MVKELDHPMVLAFQCPLRSISWLSFRVRDHLLFVFSPMIVSQIRYRTNNYYDNEFFFFNNSNYYTVPDLSITN